MWLPSPVCITKSIQDCVSASAKGQPEVHHVSKVCDYSLHTFPVGWSQILNELRQDPNCKCCIQVWDHYRPQETSDCLCVWYISHSKFLHWGRQALIFTEHDFWVHQCTDSFCIGKSKFFDHSFDITLLVDRNGLSGLVSLYFHHSFPPLAISKCCLISDLNFITSKSHFDVTTMSSVATAVIVCSSPEHLKYTEWSTTEHLKPKSFVMTAVSIFCHSHPACFKPYNAFFSLQTSFSWPGFSSPAGGTM